jgi:cell division protein FtsI (penicillin-binding protein 3)
MSAKDAVYLLENAGMKVRIYGGGTIVKQSIEPGSRMNKGVEIKLYLS